MQPRVLCGERRRFSMIQFGLRLHDAEKLPVEQVLPLVRQKGFTCAQWP